MSARPIDCMHLGHDRVICAWQVDEVLVDPGPTSCLPALLAGLDAEPRALLLTHIHLDHAGAAGVLARRFPDLRVYVHEGGAPHLADPSRLLASARRLYGDEMDRLWGEVAPVPGGRIHALSGGERVQGFEVVHAPGHASHHVVYVRRSSGELFAGDAAGVRIAPSHLAAAPTPPPEVDLDAWRRSLERLAAIGADRLCLTHFGATEQVDAQLDGVARWIDEAAERSRDGDREGFAAWLAATLGAERADVADRLRQAMPPEQLWLGLERYWRKRGEERV